MGRLRVGVAGVFSIWRGWQCWWWCWIAIRPSWWVVSIRLFRCSYHRLRWAGVAPTAMRVWVEEENGDSAPHLHRAEREEERDDSHHQDDFHSSHQHSRAD